MNHEKESNNVILRGMFLHHLDLDVVLDKDTLDAMHQNAEESLKPATQMTGDSLKVTLKATGTIKGYNAYKQNQISFLKELKEQVKK